MRDFTVYVLQYSHVLAFHKQLKSEVCMLHRQQFQFSVLPGHHAYQFPHDQMPMDE